MTPTSVDPVKLLVDALEIYSPTSEESELADFLLDRMGELGFSRVRSDGAGNAIGEMGKGRIRLLLCGHMDTVPGRIPVRVNRNSIRGRGASDAKSPLCAMLLAASAAADAGVSVTFAGVTEEEGDGKGIERILWSGGRYDYAVFGEPSGAHKITIGYRGRASVKVVVKTPGGHAGSAWAHTSAFDEFSSFMSRVRDYERTRAIPGNHYRSVTVTPTMVSAGTFHNVVPSLCEATLDLRVPPGIRISDAVRDIRALAGSHGDSAIQILPGEATEAYEADPNSSLVRAFQRAILLRLKTKPVMVRKTGTGDMNTFAQRRKAHCITYGPGDPLTSHTEGESVQVKDYLSSIDVLTEAINQLGSLAGRG